MATVLPLIWDDAVGLVIFFWFSDPWQSLIVTWQVFWVKTMLGEEIGIGEIQPMHLIRCTNRRHSVSGIAVCSCNRKKYWVCITRKNPKPLIFLYYNEQTGESNNVHLNNIHVFCSKYQISIFTLIFTFKIDKEWISCHISAQGIKQDIKIKNSTG